MQRKAAYLILSLCDEEGQFRPSVALEVDTVSIHGFTPDGLFIDIYHLDKTAERRLLRGDTRPFGRMQMGKETRVCAIRIQAEWPAANIITKAQFQELTGLERVLNDKTGHFEPVAVYPMPRTDSDRLGDLKMIVSEVIENAEYAAEKGHAVTELLKPSLDRLTEVYKDIRSR